MYLSFCITDRHVGIWYDNNLKQYVTVDASTYWSSISDVRKVVRNAFPLITLFAYLLEKRIFFCTNIALCISLAFPQNFVNREGLETVWRNISDMASVLITVHIREKVGCGYTTWGKWDKSIVCKLVLEHYKHQRLIICKEWSMFKKKVGRCIKLIKHQRLRSGEDPCIHVNTGFVIRKRKCYSGVIAIEDATD